MMHKGGCTTFGGTLLHDTIVHLTRWLMLGIPAFPVAAAHFGAYCHVTSPLCRLCYSRGDWRLNFFVGPMDMTRFAVTTLFTVLFVICCLVPSVLWHCWLGFRKSIWPVENGCQSTRHMTNSSHNQLVTVNSSHCKLVTQSTRHNSSYVQNFKNG